MDASKSEFEREREERIAENKRKLAELGIPEALAELQPAPAVKRPKQPRAKVVVPEEDKRRSARPRAEVDYKETTRAEGVPREPVDYTERLQAIQLDAETAEKLRAELESRASQGKGGKGGKGRGPVDSGKGVRVQGGRVYDSTHGVTCHWCRQKTLEDHVTCTNTNCGNGRRMPLSFCHKCLRNRHGEDAEEAAASGAWWCPCCRGSCGAGCVTCCNCGPCRKRAQMEPTHQVVRLVRDSGFDNVHDYLVHLATKEDQETIRARKAQFAWGAWMSQSVAAAAGKAAAPRGRKAAAAAAGAAGQEDNSGASEQTGGQAAAVPAGRAGQGDEVDAPRARAGSSKGSRKSDQSKPAAGKPGAKAAAAAAAVDSNTDGDQGALPAAKKGKPSGTAAAAAPAAAPEEEEEDDLDVLMGRDQPVLPVAAAADAKVPRRLRMLHKLGLSACLQ